jgi:outer membrane protein TolC
MQERIINMIRSSIKEFSNRIKIRYRIFLIISIHFYLFQPVSLYSQSDSLSHYLGFAVKNNPAVLQKFTEYKAALQKIPQAGSLPDPELTAGVLLQKMELMQGYQVADIQIMQMFPWFGVLRNAKDEMNLMAKAKFESFAEARSGLIYDVQRTWYELNKIKQELIVSQNNINILKTIERLTLIRFQSPVSTGSGSSSGEINSSVASSSLSSKGSGGMLTMGGNSEANSPAASNGANSSMGGNPMSQSQSGSGLADLYRIQIELGDLENNIESLKTKMVTLTARFNTFLNRPVTAPVELPDSLKTETFNSSVKSVSDSILLKNPMLSMLKYEQESIDARYRMVSKMGYPMVGLGLKYSIISKFAYASTAMNGKDMVMPMVTVTLPVYRKKYKAMKSEAELVKTATQQGYSAASNTLQAEFYEALQLYQDARRRQQLYANQTLLADKSLNIMLKSFSSSNAGLTDILRVRQQTLDYKFKEIEAIADYNTAIAWIKKLENVTMNEKEGNKWK